jgi:dTDP-4-amino-4,6-dideoxygalactose transaminase
MITTDSKKLYEKLKLLRNHGSRVRYRHEILGYNFRMTDLNAAIGLEQLRKLPNFNKIRKSNASYFSKKLSGIKNLEIPFIPPHSDHVFHQYTIKLSRNINREKIIQALSKKGINTGIYYPIPIHKQKLYQSLGYLDKLPVAEAAARSVLSLPVHPFLTKSDLKRIVSALSSVI